MNATTEEKRQFWILPIEYIATELRIKESYVAQMREGDRPIRPKFKSKASRFLHRTQEELFGQEEAGG